MKKTKNYHRTRRVNKYAFNLFTIPMLASLSLVGFAVVSAHVMPKYWIHWSIKGDDKFYKCRWLSYIRLRPNETENTKNFRSPSSVVRTRESIHACELPWLTFGSVVHVIKHCCRESRINILFSRRQANSGHHNPPFFYTNKKTETHARPRVQWCSVMYLHGSHIGDVMLNVDDVVEYLVAF